MSIPLFEMHFDPTRTPEQLDADHARIVRFAQAAQKSIGHIPPMKGRQRIHLVSVYSGIHDTDYSATLIVWLRESEGEVCIPIADVTTVQNDCKHPKTRKATAQIARIIAFVRRDLEKAGFVFVRRDGLFGVWMDSNGAKAVSD